MRRWAFLILCALSLLLAVASAGLWAYAHSHLGFLRFFVKDHGVVLSVFEGSVFASTMNANSIHDAPATQPRRPWLFIPTRWGKSYDSPRTQGVLLPATQHRFLGFGYSQPAGEALSQESRRYRTALFLNTLEAQEVAPDARRRALVAARIAEIRPLTVPANERRIEFPLWFCTILFGALPAWLLFNFVFRRQRYAAGLCPSCGYDLRASAQRCPECGTAVVGVNQDVSINRS